jgi:diacylglycerol kinase (ATP)
MSDSAVRAHHDGKADAKENAMKHQLAVVEHQRKVSAQTRGALRTALAEHGVRPSSWMSVHKARETKSAVEVALNRGAETLLVCGGDGTVRAAAEALVDTGVALAVLPTGTANLFAAGLGLPTDPAAVTEAIVGGNVLALDTGRCNDLTFTVMAGTGLDAAMIDEADSAEGIWGKDRLGVLAYFRAGVVHAGSRQPFGVELTVDGAPFFEGHATCVLVGNLGTLGRGLVAFPDASPMDGLLDVGIATAVGLRQWGSLMVSAARGRHDESAHIRLTQGKVIDVRLDDEHRFELDGGTKGTTSRLQLAVRPQSLLACVPQ